LEDDDLELGNGSESISVNRRLFVNIDNEPDIIFNKNQSKIISEVKKYYINRFDEYIKCLYNSMTQVGIKVMII